MALRTIPMVDIRSTGPAALIHEYDHLAHDVLKAARSAFGPLAEMAAHIALPLGDALSKRWLTRTHNPYLPEIARIADHVRAPGIYALNMSYEWACTTGIQHGDEGCHMLRTLDWPFPRMGEHLIVTHESGMAGDFHNITWPGLVGVFTAMAPGRFAIAINQAPMRAPTGTMALDWALNRIRMNRESGIPPSHLARHVLEYADNYEKAVALLTHTPICLPAIFTITGTTDREGCIIERQEREAYTRPFMRAPLCTTNHWVATPTAKRWLPREPDSYGRKGLMDAMLDESIGDDFTWLQSPVLNLNSKLAAMMNAKTGALRVVGLEGDRAVTEILSI